MILIPRSRQENTGTRVSLIPAGLNKILRRNIGRRVSDDDVDGIKSGTSESLAMGGVVNYRDAFNQSRYTNFAFTIYWPGKRRDGNDLIMSLDASRHNDSN